MPSNKHVRDSAKTQAHDTKSHVSRREFLKSAAVAGGGAAFLGGAESILAKTTTLPKPNKSGINHIVLVTMENRSFDHFLGWLPGANGVQAGLSYTDTSGSTYPTYALSDYQGCGHADPDHSYAGGRVQYDNGKCDGFLQTAPAGDTFPIGYYQQSDLAFLGQAAPGWTTFNGYFAAIMAETFPNRIYQHAAQTDRLSNSTTISKSADNLGSPGRPQHQPPLLLQRHTSAGIVGFEIPFHQRSHCPIFCRLPRRDFAPRLRRRTSLLRGVARTLQ